MYAMAYTAHMVAGPLTLGYLFDANVIQYTVSARLQGTPAHSPMGSLVTRKKQIVYQVHRTVNSSSSVRVRCR